MKPKLVILSGAGISAESGIPTFRSTDGLWENHRVEDVATPQGWRRNPQLVLDFYNTRRSQIRSVSPNPGHHACKELEQWFDVTVVTQNIDDLHERAGSSKVVHLHGEIIKAQSDTDPDLIVPIEGDITLGMKAADGGQLRPHVVWFGEAVPMMEMAWSIAALADLMIVVGTSLSVYPAAGLIGALPTGKPLYLVDPKLSTIPHDDDSHPLTFIKEPAGTGLPKLVKRLKPSGA